MAAGFGHAKRAVVAATIASGLHVSGSTVGMAQQAPLGKDVVGGLSRVTTAECMRTGGACGRFVANAWCEAHGHTRAIAFGSADDVTGAIPGSDKVFQVSSGDVLIRCGD